MPFWMGWQVKKHFFWDFEIFEIFHPPEHMPVRGYTNMFVMGVGIHTCLYWGGIYERVCKASVIFFPMISEETTFWSKKVYDSGSSPGEKVCDALAKNL